MIRISLIAGCVAMVLSLSAAGQSAETGPNAVTIPLDKIWSNGMPGTRNIEELATEQTRLTGIDLWRPIAQALAEYQRRHDGRQPAAPAFAVAGEGLEAFRLAHAVLVDNEKPRQAFRIGSPISLVFTTTPFQGHVQLREVERRVNVIDVHYRFVERMETYVSLHFALIPLGELPEGKYEVVFTQEPAVIKISGEYQTADSQFQVKLSRQLFRSFKFEIVKSDEQE